MGHYEDNNGAMDDYYKSREPQTGHFHLIKKRLLCVEDEKIIQKEETPSHPTTNTSPSTTYWLKLYQLFLPWLSLKGLLEGGGKQDPQPQAISKDEQNIDPPTSFAKVALDLLKSLIVSKEEYIFSDDEQNQQSHDSSEHDLSENNVEVQELDPREISLDDKDRIELDDSIITINNDYQNDSPSSLENDTRDFSLSPDGEIKEKDIKESKDNTMELQEEDDF